MALILVGGGARSGKSSYALQLARERGARRAFVATAQAYDDEMRERIARHQQERDPSFTTFEEPLDLAALLPRLETNFDAIVLDCLTLWLSNRMLSDRPIDASFLERASPALLIAVTNEVGCGIVPENELARRFRDEQGRLNQLAARHADEVYWMVFGCPLRVKP
jgi:adenosylcobinamide kinase/adenosylcobinamide-phosphate guanylyltransferase